MGWTVKALLALASLGCAQGWAQETDSGSRRASADTRYVARWVADSRDAGGMPYLIVDKKDARLYAFHPDGRLMASTAALLGATRGDSTVPGVGERAQTHDVAPGERTTPAGRFVTTPGRNLKGEHVVWVDYAAAFAIHRMRPGASRAGREARLASISPDDNRASLGCVVVPVEFYERVVMPLMGRSRGVVYVLPEMQPVRDLFGSM